jgi:hypothetical protein
MNRLSVTIAAAITSLSLVAGTAIASGHPDTTVQGKKRTTKVKGHYAGTNGAGRSMSFDVTGSKKFQIENFAVDVDTECWNDFDGDDESDQLLTHITGFSGNVKKDGSFDIYYAPDDDTEFEFSGTLNKGKANVDVIVGGTFDADGTSNLVGVYQCDSWGDTYRAKRGGN